MGRKPLIDENHWRVENYSERITTKQWRKILLAEADTFFCKGQFRRLIAKKIGPGIYEISKAPLEKGEA